VLFSRKNQYALLGIEVEFAWCVQLLAHVLHPPDKVRWRISTMAIKLSIQVVPVAANETRVLVILAPAHRMIHFYLCLRLCVWVCVSVCVCLYVRLEQ
jgi:hypothetical protein